MNIIRRHMGKLALFFLCCLMLWVMWQGLYTNHTTKQSKSLETFPAFSLTDIRNENATVTLNDLKSQVSIIHFFASWCSVCMSEHQDWMEIRSKWPYAIVGVVYRDDPRYVQKFLEKQGDPFTLVLSDSSGALGIKLGLRGVPENFIIDKTGKIRYRHQGTLTVAVFENEILPVIKEIVES